LAHPAALIHRRQNALVFVVRCWRKEVWKVVRKKKTTLRDRRRRKRPSQNTTDMATIPKSL